MEGTTGATPTAADAPAETSAPTETPSAEASLAASASIPHGAASQPDNGGDEIDAEWDDFVGQQAGAAGTQSKPEKQPTQKQPTPQPELDNQPDDEDDGAAGAALSDDDKKAIKRHGLDPDEITALRTLSPESRKRWIANLDKRAAYTDDLQRQLAELKGGKQPEGEGEGEATQQPQAGATASDLDAAFQEIVDGFEPYGFGDAVAPLKKAFGAVQAAQQQAMAPLQNVLRALLARVTADDQDAAFDKLELPEGVDKNDAKVRQQILEEADLLLNGNFDFRKFNYRHAIPRAAQNVFAKQLQQAEQAKKQRERKQALRGTAEPSARPPSSKPVIADDDAFDDEVLAALNAGDTEKLARLTAG